MDAHAGRTTRNGYILVFALLLLATFLALFFSRSLDDDRLTSWRYVFGFADPLKVLFLLEAGILPALLLAKSSLSDRHPLLFLFLFSYAAAAVFWREPEVIVDASRYFTQAKHLELYGAGYFLREWGKAIPAWTDMPAVPFLYGLIFRFFGETRLYIEMFTTLLFSLTVVLTCLTGRELWGNEAGFFAGMLLLGIPYLFSQVPLMLVDLPAASFLMLSVYTFIRAIERGGPTILLAAAAIFVTFFAKYSTWLMLTILPVILAVYCIRRPSQPPGRYFLRGLLIFLGAGVMIACLAVYKYDVISEQMKLLVEYQKPGLRRWGESFLSTFVFQVWPWLTAAAVYSLFRAIRKKDLRFLIVLWLPLLIVALRIERIRYSVMAFPMIALAASSGLAALRRRETAKLIVYGIAVSSIVLAASAFLPFLDRISLVNIKEAGAFLDHLGGGDVRVFTLPEEHPVANPAAAVPLLDLFTHKTLRYDYTPSFAKDSGEILTSPLRFTFEYRNPRYYSGEKAEKESAIVVISGEKGETLPPGIEQKVRGFRKMKVFDTSENVFVYQTIATIYY
jgi:Dolichyl-phosphate-mannose-protein mannosyltransferase